MSDELVELRQSNLRGRRVRCPLCTSPDVMIVGAERGLHGAVFGAILDEHFVPPPLMVFGAQVKDFEVWNELEVRCPFSGAKVRYRR